MTPFEADLLDRGIAGLNSTLQRNRELGQRSELEREAMGLRREELGERRTEREQARTDLATHRETMAQIQRETKELQDRHYRLMQSTGLLKTIQDGLKDGTISPEKLKAGLSDNPMLKELGLGVDIFQAPPANKAGFNTRAGHNLELAESYRQRIGAAQREGAVDEAERFRSIADRLERSIGPEEKEDYADISSEAGEVDPLTGKGAATVRRRVPLSQLEQEIQKMTPSVAASAGTNAPAAPTATSGERVTVISPDGKRGSIPRAQLQNALSKGYRVAQ